MEAIAKHDFNATSDDELSFKRGSLVKIIRFDDDSWYMAEQFGKHGLVPENYLEVKPRPWYKAKLSRSAAEDALKGKQDGEFLIRDSESSPGDFSLSVKFPNNVQHYKILRDGAGKYFLWVVKFDSINALIEYHRSSSVSRSEQVMLRDTCPSCTVKAMYDYNTNDSEEMSFKKGDRIEILEKIDLDWWNGKNMRTHSVGLIPANYVQEC